MFRHFLQKDSALFEDFFDWLSSVPLANRSDPELRLIRWILTCYPLASEQFIDEQDERALREDEKRKATIVREKSLHFKFPTPYQ